MLAALFRRARRCRGAPVMFPRMANRMLVVGWDGADWNILDPLLAAGELPALAALLERGSRGVSRSSLPSHSWAAWPTFLTGRLSGRTHRDLAVGVNGYIAATVPSFRRSRRGPQLFSALIPEEAFHDGPNQVDVFAVSRRRGGLHLLKLK